MKILELRFKNLNSLYGEWVIDFTEPNFVADGIFALTGPTGAGKSTILDAICLALYGATPRLGKITFSSNEIMSRQTGECYAEVMFESQAGRFRCHWEQRRARKNASGALQAQEHQISDADSGKIIESKKSLVGNVIEDKTGMDFDRFTRSILLAQGGFDTFLKADPEQKSKILEQITGTQIYSDISRRVHERQRQEKDNLGLLKAETAGIEILLPEKIIELETDINSLEKQQAEQESALAAIDKAVHWLSQIIDIKQELASLATESEAHETDLKAFEPQRAILAAANRAASLEGPYASLLALRLQQSSDLAKLTDIDTTLPDFTEAAKVLETSLKAAELTTSEAKSALEQAKPTLQKVRAIDQALADKQNSIDRENAWCDSSSAKIAREKQALQTLTQKQSESTNELKSLKQYFIDHANDEWLVSGLAGIEQQLAQLQAKNLSLSKLEQKRIETENNLNQHKQELIDRQQQLSIEQDSLTEAVAAYQHGKVELDTLLDGKLLREYQAEKDALLIQSALQSTILQLETYRAKLEDGKPCPLCGADDHPYAVGNIPSFDENEQRVATITKLLLAAEMHQDKLRRLEEKVSLTKHQLQTTESKTLVLNNDVKAVDQVLKERTDEINQQTNELVALRQSTARKLAPLGITDLPEDTTALLHTLTERLGVWRLNTDKKAEIDNKLAELQLEHKGLEVRIAAQAAQYQERQEQLVELRRDHSKLADERRTLFGEARVDIEEQRLAQALLSAEISEKNQRKAYTDRIERVKELTTQRSTLQKSIEERSEPLLLAEEKFVDSLTSTEFVSENSFLASRLTTEQRDALTAKAQQLDSISVKLMLKKQDRRARLDEELAKQLTDQPLESLLVTQQAFREQLKTTRDNLTTHKHRLSENTRAKAKIAEKQELIEEQQQELSRWEKLHGLIGSADGKRYRNFAQGLTFELMVSHANRQLEKMTDRYLLMRDDNEPLALNVYDNYQAGEVRSTKNLSGGESFIISLTLALGLSKMASQKVRVDSLFLDEGFGTLDEDALETALETLSGLQQEGKLIGVISHISALKQRISTQISVTPIAGGKSKLTGPGCRKILSD